MDKITIYSGKQHKNSEGEYGFFSPPMVSCIHNNMVFV